MRFSSFPRSWSLALTALALAAFGIVGLRCALGLDFESLSNACNAPRFDVATYDTYCGGQLTVLPRYIPAGVGLDQGNEDLVQAPVADVENGVVALATTARREETGRPGICDRLTLGVHIGTLDPHLGFQAMGSFSGITRQIVYRVSREDSAELCADATAQFVWPTDIEILQTSPTIRVLATFLEGGLLYVEFEPGEDAGTDPYIVARALHVPGTDGGPTRWICDLGSCVLEDLEPCDTHGDCRGSSYCGEQQCTPVPVGECSGEEQCPEELRCDTGLDPGRCRIPCSHDPQCPPPQLCSSDDNFCGGTGRCVSGESSCGEHGLCFRNECFSSCSPEAPAWDEQPQPWLRCIDVSEVTGTSGDGIWASTGSFGSCAGNPDCRLYSALALEVIPPRRFFQDQIGLVILSHRGTARLGTIAPNGGLQFSPFSLTPEPFAPGRDDVLFTDAEFDPGKGRLYLAATNLGVVEIDLTEIEADELTVASFSASDWVPEYYTVPDLGPDQVTWLSRIHLFGSALVTVETDSQAEIIPPARGVRQTRIRLFQAKEPSGFGPVLTHVLGDSTAPSVGLVNGDANLLLIVADLPDGVRAVLHDLTRPTQPLVDIEMGDTIEITERSLPTVTDQAIFLSNDKGLLPVLLSIDGQRR